MNRRRVLVGIGGSAIVAASGCLERVMDSGSNGDASDDPEPLGFSLRSVDSAPEPLSFEITVSNDQLTVTAMPELEIAVENTGTDSVSWSYAGGVSNLPLQQGIHDSEAGALVIGLTKEVESQLLDVSDGCARVDQFLRADAIKNTALESGDRIQESYAIVGVERNLEGTCPTPGEYRLEQDLGEYGTWGFDFELA